MKSFALFLFVLRRRVVALARAIGATLAEPGPLETDAFRHEQTVFQRADVRRTR